MAQTQVPTPCASSTHSSFELALHEGGLLPSHAVTAGTNVMGWDGMDRRREGWWCTTNETRVRGGGGVRGRAWSLHPVLVCCMWTGTTFLGTVLYCTVRHGTVRYGTSLRPNNREYMRLLQRHPAIRKNMAKEDVASSVSWVAPTANP